MDYKEKYEKALEWMKSIYPTMQGSDKEDAEHYFPELAESEGERMINGLQGFLSAFGSDYFGTDGWQKFDDWLEKQKEQKPVENSGKELLYVSNKSYNIGYRDGKREAEQKPEWSKNDTAFLNEITDFFENKTIRLQHDLDMYAHWLKSLPERFNLEPKPEWSEEDEKMSEGFMHKLEVCDLLTNKEITWAKHRLNSLHPQPKQEWSEEDEVYLQDALWCVEKAEKSCKDDEDKGACWSAKRWLKSLRPSWKPSDEQMEALRRASVNEYVSAEQFDILVSLYAQLKKL